jgi:hypothetical protein
MVTVSPSRVVGGHTNPPTDAEYVHEEGLLETRPAVGMPAVAAVEPLSPPFASCARTVLRSTGACDDGAVEESELHAAAIASALDAKRRPNLI